MRNILSDKIKQSLLGLAIATSPLAYSEAIPVTVVIKGIGSNSGGVVLSAYDDAEKWFSEDVVARIRAELNTESGEEITIPLELEPGEYALTAYHDENDNKKMDANFIGIPKEPTGLSNDHRPKFGPPKYKKAAVEVREPNQRIEITLR